MTREQLRLSKAYGGSKTRTFYAGEEFYNVMEWIMSEVETRSEGQTGCLTTKQYSIAIKVVNKNPNGYKQKKPRGC